MNILFLANRFPYPPFRGDKLKIFNLAKQLSGRHNLFLLTFIQDRQDYIHVPVLEQIFREVRLVELPGYRSAINCVRHCLSDDPVQINYFKSAEMKNALHELLDKHDIDVIHTQHLRMSQYTADIHSVKTILDLPDAYSMYWKRRFAVGGNGLRKAFETIEYKKILKYEKNINNFDMTLVCSDEDKEYLNKEHNARNIEILYNGVDTDTFFSDGHNYDIDDQIIFSGNMGYYPNIDAAIYFVHEIFPQVLKKFPKVKFRIAGQNPSKKILELESQNVVVTGFVKSLRGEYAGSSIAVSPVRVGAGTMNKVLEPMAMGVPVVMSEIGFKGIGARRDSEVMMASTKEEFSDCVCRLLSDRELRKSIGSAGKTHVLNNFTWEKISADLESYCLSLAGHIGTWNKDLRSII